jgi:hypothetical protein
VSNLTTKEEKVKEVTLSLGKKANMNSEFIEKMIQAKKLECEALLSLLPESQKGHVEVIEKEISAMVKECAAAGVSATVDTLSKIANELAAETTSPPKTASKNSKKTVKKVDIE